MINGAQAQAEAQIIGVAAPHQFSIDFTLPVKRSTGRPTLFEAVASRLNAAVTRAALIAEAQRIQHLSEHWQMEQAARIVKQKLSDFRRK